MGGRKSILDFRRQFTFLSCLQVLGQLDEGLLTAFLQVIDWLSASLNKMDPNHLWKFIVTVVESLVRLIAEEFTGWSSVHFLVMFFKAFSFMEEHSPFIYDSMYHKFSPLVSYACIQVIFILARIA